MFPIVHSFWLGWCVRKGFFILFYWNDENTTDLLLVGLSCGPLCSYQFSPCSIQRCAHSKTHYNPSDLLPWRSAKLCVLESRMAAKRVAPGHSWCKYCPCPFEDRQSGAHVTWVGNRSPPADVSTFVCNIKSLHYPLSFSCWFFSNYKTKFGCFSPSYCRFVLLTFSLNLFIYKFLWCQFLNCECFSIFT